MLSPTEAPLYGHCRPQERRRVAAQRHSHVVAGAAGHTARARLQSVRGHWTLTLCEPSLHFGDFAVPRPHPGRT